MSATLRRGLLLLCLLSTVAAAFWPQPPDEPRPPSRAAGATAPQAVPERAASGLTVKVRPGSLGPSASAPGPVPMAVALTLFGPAQPRAPKRPLPPPAAPPPAPEPEAPAPAAPPAPPPLRLRGLFAEGAAAPRALLEDARGQAWLLSAGDWLDGPGAAWQLETVDAEGVQLRHRDGQTRHRLRLPPPG
jgi:hypothetical protein